jgi:hypothetical protein
MLPDVENSGKIKDPGSPIAAEFSSFFTEVECDH